MVKERIILGIDPGSVIMGYGILRILDNKPHLEAMGVIQLGKYEDYYLRLKKIFERVLELIDHYHPDELAIEAPFFGKNVQSMLKLGRAQGVAIAAALERDIPIFEYAPLKIRGAIVPAANLGSKACWIFIIGGLLFGANSFLINIGILLFSLSVLFQLVTLPVEFDASRRAVAILGQTGILGGEELRGTRKVLSAAALTYVASAAAAILSLLRLILLFGNRRD